MQANESAVRSSGAEQLVPLLCLLGSGSMLGLSTVFAKMAPGAGVSPLAFLAWSLVGGTLVLTLIGAVRGRLPSFDARTVEYFLVAGFVGLAAPTLIFFSAVPHVGASFVAVSIALPPLYTYTGTLLLRMERFDPWRALGVALTLAGSLLLAVLKLSVPGAPTFWVVATLSAPVLLAAGNIYRTLRWPPGSGSDQLAPGMVGAAALVLLVVGALPGGSGVIPELSLAVPAGEAAAMALIAAQAAAFAVQYLLFFVVQRRGGPVYISLLGSVAAVVGSVIAIGLLGEAAPEGLLIGGALIALGVGLVVRGGAKSSWDEGAASAEKAKEAHGTEKVTTKERRTMKIADADHTNWRVRDLERSMGFYRDLLGLEPFGLDEYRRGERSLVSLRVTPTFILHLRPDPGFEPVPTGGYDHLALVVEGTSPDALAEHLADGGVEVERRSEGAVGARGAGRALYARDPDGYLLEFKFYGPESGGPDAE